MEKGIKTLLGDIAYKCICNKLSFNMEYEKVVDVMKFPCSGFFDEKALVVATNKKNKIDWTGTVIHESCHLDQYLEKSPVYTKGDIGLHVVEDWITGKQKDKKKAMKAFMDTVYMELDCEIRSVKKFKRYKIKFNEKEYIRQANAYLYSYVYGFLNKKWFPTPYEKKSIVKNMPSKFCKPVDYFTNFYSVEKYFK